MDRKALKKVDVFERLMLWLCVILMLASFASLFLPKNFFN